MANIEIFKNERLGEIRTITDENNEPWFCLADVCKAVELTNPSSVKARLDADDTKLVDLHALKYNEGMVGNSMATFVNESALYDVLLCSNSTKVKPFRKWVTKEVLPSIRKTGSYSLQHRIPQTFAEALRLAADLQEENERQQALLLEQAPKVEFYDDVVDSRDALPMAMVAKTLNMGIGRNKLFSFLRGKKVLRWNNEPYQDFVEKGWFRCVESKYTKPNGDVCVNIKTVVLQKGLDGIRKLLKRYNAGNN